MQETKSIKLIRNQPVKNQQLQMIKMVKRKELNQQLGLIHTRNCLKTNQSQSLDILNCFDNLSLVIEEQHKNNNLHFIASSRQSSQCLQQFKIKTLQPNRCIEPKKYEQWSLSNSPSQLQKTFVKEAVVIQQCQIINKQINLQNKQKKTESVLQDYSFNIQQSKISSAFNIYLPPQNSNAPFTILMQKLDLLLQKQAAQKQKKFKYAQNKSSTVSNSAIRLSSQEENYRRNHFIKNQFNNSSFQKVDNNNLMQKIEFYASYIQSLEQQNISLRINNQKLFQQKELVTAQVAKLNNNLKQKQIIIKYLNQQIKNFSTNESGKNKNNKISKQKLTKRNTVDGQKLNNHQQKNCHFDCSFNKNNQRRASQYQGHLNKEVKFIDRSFNKNKQNLYQNMNVNNVDSLKQQDLKINNFSSNRLSFGSFANSSNHKSFHKKQNIQLKEEVPLILKKQNEILITKLNILYQDYENLISKFNQMCSQKEAQSQILNKKSTSQNIQEKKMNNPNKQQQNEKKISFPIIELGYEKKIAQIINKIKSKRNFYTHYKNNTYLKKQSHLNSKNEQIYYNKIFQTEESKPIMDQHEDKIDYYLPKKTKHQRTKSEIINKYSISQPQTQRTFFNKDLKPIIYSYNNSFCQEQQYQPNQNNLSFNNKRNLLLNFKKNKLNVASKNQNQNQKRRSRQAPKSQRTNNSQRRLKVMKIQ